VLRKALLASQALIALLLAGAPAAAEAPRLVRLEYERQEGAAACPDDVAIRAGVAARLGYEPFRERADDRLRTTIRQAGHALEARIELMDAGGRLTAERRLISRNRDCSELASSVELAIAIAIDPMGAPPATQPDAAAPPAFPVAEGAQAGKDQPARATPPEAATTPTRRLAKQVEAGLLGGLGSAPGASLGFMAGASLVDASWSLGFEARADLPASSKLRAGEASAWLLVGSIVPCLRFGISVCALATGGARQVAGDGLVDSRHATLAYLALGGRVGLALPLGAATFLTLHGDVTAPVTKTRLRVDDSVVWTSPAVAFALGAGVAVRFP
jgi:hypothetical protein